eukprot:SM000364S13663  [mRNA]  locus=s364:50699:52272:+ [translate_table: standard]
MRPRFHTLLENVASLGYARREDMLPAQMDMPAAYLSFLQRRLSACLQRAQDHALHYKAGRALAGSSRACRLPSGIRASYHEQWPTSLSPSWSLPSWLPPSPATPITADYSGGATSVSPLETAIVDDRVDYCDAYGCYTSSAGYTVLKANTYTIAASDAAMTTEQESGLGFSKLTLPQCLQSYSLLYNGATAFTLAWPTFNLTNIPPPAAVPSLARCSLRLLRCQLHVHRIPGPVHRWRCPPVVHEQGRRERHRLGSQGGDHVRLYQCHLVRGLPPRSDRLHRYPNCHHLRDRQLAHRRHQQARPEHKGDSCSIVIPVGPLPAATATWSGVQTIYQPGSGACPIASSVYFWARKTYPAGGTLTNTATKIFLKFLYSTLGQSLIPLPFLRDPTYLCNQNINAVATIT